MEGLTVTASPKYVCNVLVAAPTLPEDGINGRKNNNLVSLLDPENGQTAVIEAAREEKYVTS